METSQQIEYEITSPSESSDVSDGENGTRRLFDKIYGFLFPLTVSIALAPTLFTAIGWRLNDDAFWVVVPLFLLTVMIAVARARREPLEGVQERSWIVLGLYIAAMPMLAFAYLISSSWLTLLVSLILATAVAIRLSATTRSSDYLSVLVLMLLLVWVPFGVNIGIQRVLTDWVFSSVSAIIDLQGWAHRREGGFLAFSDFRLDLKPVLEGYVSLVSILYFCGLLAFVRRRAMIHTTVMMVFSVVIVWGVLSLRLLVVSIFAMKLDVHEWVGWLRWMLELGTFAVVALVAYGLDQSLAGVFGKIRLDGEFANLRTMTSRRFVESWNWICSYDLLAHVRRMFTRRALGRNRWLAWFSAILCWCLVLPVLGLALLSLNLKLGSAGISRLHSAGMVPEERLITFGDGDYRPAVNGWRVVNVSNTRRDSKSVWGEFSETWTVQKDASTLVLSVDYAFDDWHDVKECYMGKDWQLRGEQIVQSLTNPAWDLSQTRMINVEGKPSIVFCSHSNFSGQSLQSGPVGLLPKLKYRLLPQNWGSPYDVMLTSEEKTRYQFQLIHSSSTVIDESARREIQLVYEDFREQIRKNLQIRAGK